MPNTFTPEQIAQILEEFFKTVGTRQYIGARYVPIFGRKDEASIEWDNTKPYEPLTIVLYQGNSYTSRQYVPTGVEITNEEFWAITGNYNAQVEQYRRETAQALETAEAARETAEAAREAATNAQTDIDNLLPKSDFTAESTVKDYIDNAQSSADTAQNDIDTLLPKSAFSTNSTVKDYIDLVNEKADKSVFLAIATSNNTLQPGYNTPKLCISKDGIAFTPIKDLPPNHFFTSDAKVSYIDEIDKFIIVVTNSDASIPKDMLWTVTEDFVNFDNYAVTLGLSDFRDSRYPEAGAGANASRRWVPVISKDENGNYYASVSMTKTVNSVADVYNSGFTRQNMGIFMVPISIDSRGYPTANGNPTEIIISRLDNSVVNSAFDHSIIFDSTLNKYVMSYKDGEYNFTSVATATSINGPYINIAENVFHMIGTEASWITKTPNGYYIYAQNDGNYLYGLTNYMITSDSFDKYGANPYPRLTTDDRLWIRNLSPIFISENILSKHIDDFSSDGIQTGSNKKPLLAQNPSRINNIYNGSLARFSVIDGMKIQAVPNDEPINIDYFWPVATFDIVLRSKVLADQTTVPTLVKQTVNLYRDNTVVSNGELDYLDFITIPYLVTLNNGNVSANEPIYSVCMLQNKVAKTFTAPTLSETSTCVLHTTDMSNILILLNINGAIAADAYYDFVGFPTTNSSFVKAYNNNGNDAGLFAIGGRNNHMITAMTQILANSHTQAMIML